MTAARASQQRAAANPCYFAQVGRSQRCEYVGRWPQLFLKAHCIDPWRQRGKMKAPETQYTHQAVARTETALLAPAATGAKGRNFFSLYLLK
jgi:hypothetical protein